MGKGDINEILKKRMEATQRASELTESDEAYEALFQTPATALSTRTELPIDSLTPFFTADIGFNPYPEANLRAFAEQIKEEGILERILVRPIPDSDRYEILAGHNRTAAAKLAGFETVPAEIVEADDARAIVIATATNLLRRQELSLIERGKAYKALLDAKNRNGQHNAGETLGEVRQRYNARQIVAEFFGVTEYEIRKAVKLTRLIQPIQTIMEEDHKRLSLAVADMIADYDEKSQETILLMCERQDIRLDMATMKHIARTCPPPTAAHKALVDAWNDVQRAKEKRLTAPPKKITFDRKRFAPYLEKLGGEKELEEMFLSFLRERVG